MHTAYPRVISSTSDPKFFCTYFYRPEENLQNAIRVLISSHSPLKRLRRHHYPTFLPYSEKSCHIRLFKTLLNNLFEHSSHLKEIWPHQALTAYARTLQSERYFQSCCCYVCHIMWSAKTRY